MSRYPEGVPPFAGCAYPGVRQRLLGSDRAVAAVVVDPNALTETQTRARDVLSDILHPRTHAQQAATIGIPEDELSELESDPVFRRLVNERAEKVFRESRYAILNALMRSALSGDQQAMKSVLAAFGEVTERVDSRSVNVSIEFRDYSDEELDRRVRDLLEKLVYFEDVEEPEGSTLVMEGGGARRLDRKREPRRVGGPASGKAPAEGLE